MVIPVGLSMTGMGVRDRCLIPAGPAVKNKEEHPEGIKGRHEDAKQ
jgi:hypothetical protein